MALIYTTMNSRRKFIKNSTLGLSGIAFGTGNMAAVGSSDDVNPVHVFSKCLQFLNYREMADVLANLGFDGADLTVRPGGHVLPENVASDLPKAVQTLRRAGIDTNMIVTGINDPEDEFTRPVLKAMADSEIKYYRMGYFDYDKSKSIIQNLESHKITIEKLENLNREYGVHGDYQNHAGTRVGGPVWDLYQLLKDRDPEYTGVQYDVRHAMVEGGYSWIIGMKLVAPWITTTAIKDFIWEKNNNGKWVPKSVPLGKGMVDFKSYMEIFKSLSVKAPVSVHYEYDLGGAEHGSTKPSMNRELIYNYLAEDLKFLKNLFAGFL